MAVKMAVKFAGTMNAINRGLDATKPAKGADMVEDWEAALADLDVVGAKGILRDLGSLRKQLEKDEPDADQGGQVAGQAKGIGRGPDRGGRGSARRGRGY